MEELLRSILNGYFIGTILILDTSEHNPMFAFRNVDGLDELLPKNPHNRPSTLRLVLDGQQRITSLFYALYQPPINLKNTAYPYRFYLKLDEYLDFVNDRADDLEEAVVSLSVNDRRRNSAMNDLIKENKALPFTIFLESSQFYDWLFNKQKKYLGEERELVENIYKRFVRLSVPVIDLPHDIGKDNIINIFEKINSTGEPLTLFELAVARFSIKEIPLRELWDKYLKKNSIVGEILNPDSMLKFIALLEGKVPKKSTLLEVVDTIKKEQFLEYWEDAETYIYLAIKKIMDSHGGYGAYRANLIPYSTIVVPLAMLLKYTKETKSGADTYRKIDEWYWCNVFGQRYASATDSKSHQDYKEVKEWMEGGEKPNWMKLFNVENIDIETDEKASAIYTGIMNLIVLEGAKDFITGQNASLENCQDDHIFPQSVYRSKFKVDTISNRTLISTNQTKGKLKPSEFIPVILEKHGGNKKALLNTLASHLVPEEAFDVLKRDDYEEFLKIRKKLIVQRIKVRTGQDR